MLIHLNRASYSKKLCPVQRPFLISIDADIPLGAGVDVVVEGVTFDHKVWKGKYISPIKQHVPSTLLRRLWLNVRPAKASLGFPFIYALILEGNGWQYTYDAQSLSDARDKSPKGEELSIMLPEVLAEVDRATRVFNTTGTVPAQRPYLTSNAFRGALISASSTQKPYIVDIDGGGFSDSLLRVSMDGTDAYTNPWSMVVDAINGDYVTTRQPLPISSLGEFAFGLDMRASSDGHSPPSLMGIAIEGDGRRFYLGAKEIAHGTELSESMELMVFNNSRVSILTLKASMPAHFGFPSIMSHLDEMFTRGDFVPDSFKEHFTDIQCEMDEI